MPGLKSATGSIETTGNDSIYGAAGTGATLGAADVINGGAGYNALILTTDASFSLNPGNVTNIQHLGVNGSTGGGTTATVTGVTSVEEVTNNASTTALTFTGVAKASKVNVLNTSAATTVTFADTAVTGTNANPAVTLTLSGVTGAAAVNLNSATGDASGVATVNVTSSGLTNSATLTSNDTSVKTVNISGSTALTLALGTNVTTTATTVNATNASGAVTISGFGAAAHTVTGGSGDDLFNFGANLGTTDTINGGGGVNTLGANGAQLAAITTSSKPTVSNIQGLMLADDVATTATVVSSDAFGTIYNVRIADQGATGAAVVTFNGLTAAAAGASNTIRFDGDLGGSGGAYAFNITDATVGGNANSVTLDMRGGATTATSTITLNGVETIVIDTTNATGTQLFNITDPALTTLTVKGVQSVDVDGAALGTAVQLVDATGLTGSAGINVALSGSAISGATVKGGAGSNVIAGTQLADNITGGAAADTITGGAGIDTISIAASANVTDTIKISAAAANGVDRDIITGFKAGATNGDVFNLNSGVATLTGTDNFVGATSLQKVTTAGNITTAAAAEVVVYTGATIADVTSANSLNGTNLLAAINGTITGAVAGQNDLLFAVGVAGGGTAIYYASSADNAIIASEITLVGVLNSVAVNDLVVGNFANGA